MVVCMYAVGGKIGVVELMVVDGFFTAAVVMVVWAIGRGFWWWLEGNGDGCATVMVVVVRQW